MTYTQFFSKSSQKLPNASLTNVIPPVFGGITSLVANTNGSLTANWTAGTATVTPIRYHIYVQANTATGLFATPSTMQMRSSATSAKLFFDSTGTLLVAGTTYYVGIRAFDGQGLSETNVVSFSAVSQGVVTDSVGNIVAAIKVQTDKFLFDGNSYVKANAETVSDKTGYSLSPTDETNIGLIPAIKAQTDKFGFDGSNNVLSKVLVNADKTGYALTGGEEDAIVTKVWAALQSANTVSGSFGAALQGVMQNAATALSQYNSLTSIIGNIPTNPQLASVALTQYNALTSAVAAIPINPQLASVALSQYNVITAALAAIPITPQLAAVALSQYNALIAALGSIQNNTSFSGIVPQIMDEQFGAGTKTYTFYASVFADDGTPVDPDTNVLNYTVKDVAGTVLKATAAMTRASLGNYTGTFTVTSAMGNDDISVFFNYAVLTVAYQQVRTSKISATGTDSTNIAAIKVQTDKLLFDISSNVKAAAEVVIDKTGYSPDSTTAAEIAAIKAQTDQFLFDVSSYVKANAETVSDKTGYSLGSTDEAILASIPAIKAKTDQLGFTGGNVNAEAKVVSDKTGYALTGAEENAIVDKVWNAILTAYTTPQSAGLILNELSLGATPTGIAQAVWDQLRSANVGSGSFGEALQGVLSVLRANKLDNLDVLLSSRASQTSLDSSFGNMSTLVTNLQTTSSALQTTSATIANTETELQADVASLETTAASIDAAATVVSDSANTIADAEAAITQAASDIADQATSLGTSVGNLNNAIANVKADITEIEIEALDDE